MNVVLPQIGVFIKEEKLLQKIYISIIIRNFTYNSYQKKNNMYFLAKSLPQE